MSNRSLSTKRITTNGRVTVYTEIAVNNKRDGKSDCKKKSKPYHKEVTHKHVVSYSNGKIGSKQKSEHYHVLIVSQISSKVNVQFYNPRTYSFVGRVKSCPSTHIHAVIYIKAMEMVLLAEQSRKEINSMFLKENHCSTVLRTLLCKTMKLHHRQQRVYIIPRIRHKEISVYTMTVNGSDLRNMFTITGYKRVLDMALDEKKDLIYAVVYGSIISFTTDGQDILKKISVHRVNVLCVDTTGLKLYFVQGRGLREFNTLTNSTRKLGRSSKVPSVPTSVEWFMDRIFVTFATSPYFYIIEKKDWKKENLKAKTLSRVLIAPPVTRT